MMIKKLVETARDVWRMRRMPSQVRAKDTRLAFSDIIVRNRIETLYVVENLPIQDAGRPSICIPQTKQFLSFLSCIRATKVKQDSGSERVRSWN